MTLSRSVLLLRPLITSSRTSGKIVQKQQRWYSSTYITLTRERMRVAVVGGGVSGLASALHLAPLVSKGLISCIDVFEATASKKTRYRDIGVGIWSTALEPFLHSKEESHQMVFQKMISRGSWIREVGYRTPKGSWLVHSKLPEFPSREDDENNDMPALLFLRERDLVASLRTALHIEEHKGNVKVYSDSKVTSIFEQSPHPWSAPVVFQNGKTSDRDYHLIVAADGINSVLRSSYGGQQSANRRLTGTDVFQSSAASSIIDPESVETKASWDAAKRAAESELEDRKYTVFRGNSELCSKELCETEKNFQTWGEGRSMRFATVSMSSPSSSSSSSTNGSQTGQQRIKEEKQVWFITIDDDKITSEPDPTKRRDLLLEAFADWHSPIQQMVEATPADEILMERAVAHKHCMGPVVDLNKLLKSIRGKHPPSSGRGPAIAFIGDAFMTVDPILAQGFSVGMEGAANLPAAVEKSCVKYEDLLMDPNILRNELKKRHEDRLDRLLHVLRATELVQALGQPRGGTLIGFLAKNFVRPCMRIAPDFIKTPFFNAMLKYSLGVPLSGKKKKEESS